MQRHKRWLLLPFHIDSASNHLAFQTGIHRIAPPPAWWYTEPRRTKRWPFAHSTTISTFSIDRQLFPSVWPDACFESLVGVVPALPCRLYVPVPVLLFNVPHDSRRYLSPSIFLIRRWMDGWIDGVFFCSFYSTRTCCWYGKNAVRNITVNDFFFGKGIWVDYVFEDFGLVPTDAKID